MKDAVTAVLASLFLVAVLGVYAALTLNRVSVNPDALARLVAKEIEDVYGYRVLSLGASCTVEINQTHVIVRAFSLEGSCRIDVSREVIPSAASGDLIVIHGNTTHLWISSRIEYSPLQVRSSIFNMVFEPVGFENATIQGDEALARVAIHGVDKTVEVRERVYTDNRHAGLWDCGYWRVWSWGSMAWHRPSFLHYVGNYVYLEDSYERRQGYYFIYIKDRTFKGEVKVEFKFKSGFVYIFILDPEGVEEMETYGHAWGVVYSHRYVGHSYWNWKPTFNETVSYSKPFMIRIGTWKTWGFKK